ncbi:hypothetical protein GUJ93_ZPchr0003g18463 [Zizania palustris]|uniref:Homeobox domain-containing protein n=1 Tax=Zizania palustris TaxID=103762 RepID=A0A8J5SFB7_ZIZPA|nr:hypothetical protein GUJ93_ZPchr0003g18463 [Zizania palustris]
MKQLRGGDSSEDEQETAGNNMLGALPEFTISSCTEDKELKSRLLNKYSGYLSSLWREISKKKKKGKLPRDARQKLLTGGSFSRWPYHRSWLVGVCMQELEKATLSESTGLDAKQINNWFINQRKRHWKPTPPAAMEYRSLQPANYGGASASSSSAAAAVRSMEGHYFTGGSAYPHGAP